MSNDHLVLISGKSSTGKSACLMNIKNPEGVMYLNCEGKKLPFKSKFKEFKITDPYQIHEAFDVAETMEEIHTIVIDSLAFMMSMFQSVHVENSPNGLKAWGEYSTFFKTLLLQYVAKSTKNVIFTAHTVDQLNEAEMVQETFVKIQGGLMAVGVESFFSTVISTKKVSIKTLKDFSSPYLNITEDEEMLGFKYVFQTRLTKDTVNERIRGPLSMWSKEETYIDNNIQFVMDRLHEYYD